MRAPNKKRHEEQIDEIHVLLALKEENKRKVVETLRVDRDLLTNIRNQKEEIHVNKNAVFEKLDFVNKEAQKMIEKVQKVRGGIVYQTELEIDQQIRKLEYQINKNNFNVAEERRIVSEINRLKRSKNSLREYNTLKAELDELRNRQRLLREEREVSYRETKDLRRREDFLRTNIREQSKELDTVKREIDQLWADKRGLVVRFREQDTRFRSYLKHKRDEQHRKIMQEKENAAAEERKELEELKAMREPHQEEKALVKLLINYCESLLGSSSLNSTPSEPSHTLSLDSNLLFPPSCSDRRRSSGFSSYSATSDCSSMYATPLGEDQLCFNMHY